MSLPRKPHSGWKQVAFPSQKLDFMTRAKAKIQCFREHFSVYQIASRGGGGIKQLFLRLFLKQRDICSTLPGSVLVHKSWTFPIRHQTTCPFSNCLLPPTYPRSRIDPDPWPTTSKSHGSHIQSPMIVGCVSIHATD